MALTLREVAEKVNEIIHQPRTPEAEKQICKLAEENGFTLKQIEKEIWKLLGKKPATTVSVNQRGGLVITMKF